MLANPPFSLKEWGHSVWSKGDPYGRDSFGVPPQSYGDLAFVQHMLASLKDKGLLAVVLPHGVLFRGGAEGKIRQKLLEHDLVDAVIGLAPNLFYGAGIPACIVILRKSKPEDHQKKVLIINGAEQFLEGKAQNHLTDAHIETLSQAYLNYEDVDRLARVVPGEEIQSNEFNLNISRYVHLHVAEDDVDVEEEVLKLMELQEQRDQAEAKMMGFLKELGYVE